MSHYFTNDEVKSKERVLNVKINDTDLKFITDNGVFSKKGLDFGTRTLLENINIDDIKGDVLDFGCGYGPVGIYIKMKTSAYVDMVDINERALKLAIENAKLNNVKVNVFKSDIYENVNKKYNFIITNPPIRVGKKVLYQILICSLKHLKDNGVLYFVINKDQGAKSLMKDLSADYKIDLVKKNKGFYVISAQNH